MALYWRARSIPELSTLPKPVRRHVYRWAVRRAFAEGRLKWPLFWLVSASVAVAVSLLGYEVVFVGGLPDTDPVSFLVWMFASVRRCGVLVGFTVPSALWFSHVVLSRVRPYVREYLTSGA